MLEVMRRLALDWLAEEFGIPPEIDPERWYDRVQETDPALLFPMLIEPGEKIERYYTLRPDPNDEQVAVLEVHDFKRSERPREKGDNLRLPFNQPSGSQSAALGPVLKRTAGNPSKGKPPGPTAKIQETTLRSFDKIAEDEHAPWSPYFARAAACFRRPRIYDMATGKETQGAGKALATAIKIISEKKTVYLCYQEPDGRLPGEVEEYTAYLQSVLRRTKYATSAVEPEEGAGCSLCGKEPTAGFPNALRGAGLDLANMDRAGAFPGVDDTRAVRRFATCGECADLLYIYKYYVSGQFQTRVAGEKALIIPATRAELTNRRRFVARVKKFVEGISADQVISREDALIRLLKEDMAVTDLTVLWADFGQRIEDVRGIVVDVLPSRLRAIEQKNREIRSSRSPLFPEHELDEFRYDLALSILGPLLERPGGRKVRGLNESKRLFDLRRELAASIYHEHGHVPRRFWDEVLVTARCHIDRAREDNGVWGFLYEGYSEKKRTAYLTTASWVLQLTRFLHYLRLLGRLPMPEPESIYQPRCEALRPYFTAESAIDTRQKAFAFILGALFGKLMQVQAARGVNVGANALTWLKRLTLTGKDLPGLYNRVREKLLVYETEASETVRQLVAELGELGTITKWDDDLDEVQTAYFLLLGQSLATRIMPGRVQPNERGEGQ